MNTIVMWCSRSRTHHRLLVYPTCSISEYTLLRITKMFSLTQMWLQLSPSIPADFLSKLIDITPGSRREKACITWSKELLFIHEIRGTRNLNVLPPWVSVSELSSSDFLSICAKTLYRRHVLVTSTVSFAMRNRGEWVETLLLRSCSRPCARTDLR